MSLGDNFKVAVVTILLFHLQQKQLHISLRAQVYISAPILPNRNPIFLQETGSFQQRPQYIHQFWLREVAILQFLLLYRSLKCEIIVIAVGVNLFMLYANLVLYGAQWVHYTT